MILEHQSKNKAVLLVIFIVLLIAVVSYAVWLRFSRQSEPTEPVYCTQEAKQCPDGSYVGRTGPECEFAACPPEANDLWETATDSEAGLTFQYPEHLLTEYINTADWPPQVQVLNEPFICNDLPAEASAQAGAGSETERSGQTLQRIVNDRTYCVTKIIEGAAGSIYTQYAYAFSQNDKTVIFTFSLRAVQCANYDNPQQTACENERSSFDVDGIVDRMAQTLRFEEQ